MPVFHGSDLGDILEGKDQDDVLYGLRGSDFLYGKQGNDILVGGTDGQIDMLFGGIGEDVLNGGRGKDDLTGGADRDVMTGGRETDTFHFTDLSHFVAGSSKNDLDFITDFEKGVDVIDLSDVDADTGVLGNQAFAIVEKFSGQAGELSEIKSLSTNDAQIWGGDVDGDGSADFMFAVNIIGGNLQQLEASDFLL